MDWPSRNTGQRELKKGITHEIGMAELEEVQQTKLNDIMVETM